MHLPIQAARTRKRVLDDEDEAVQPRLQRSRRSTLLPPTLVPLSLSMPSSLHQELLETPTLKRFQLKIHKECSLIICTLCHAGVLLSHVWQHVKASENKIRVPNLASVGNPTKQETHYISVPHGMKPGFTKDKLLAAISDEVKTLLGLPTIWDWEGVSGGDGWRETACPLEGQSLPLKGIRTFEGYICNLCPGPNPACFLTLGSAQQHKKTNHKNHKKTKGANRTRKGHIQSKSLSGGFVSFYPVPEPLPVEQTPAGANTQETRPILDLDSDAAWDAMMDDQQTALLPNSTRATTKPGVLDEKTLPLFYRDFRVHNFLSQQSHDECRSLCSIPERRGASVPRPLKRLYTAIADTFLQDCEMVLNMSPAVRRLIIQSDP